jgi:hypothetical protein
VVRNVDRGDYLLVDSRNEHCAGARQRRRIMSAFIQVKHGWLLKGNERVFLGDIRRYWISEDMLRVFIDCSNGHGEVLMFTSAASAYACLHALDRFYGVGENDSTIELKP